LKRVKAIFQLFAGFLYTLSFIGDI